MGILDKAVIAALADRSWLPRSLIAVEVELSLRLSDLLFERCLTLLAEGFVVLYRDVGNSKLGQGARHRIVCTARQLRKLLTLRLAYIDGKDNDTRDQAGHDTSQ